MNDVEKNGFAIMAIVTLLIDALAQFRRGLKDTKGINYNVYTSFLNDSLGDAFMDASMANDFYNKVRCGILHSAQTCDESVLTVDGEIICKENQTLYVNVKGMYDRLTAYVNTYAKELEKTCNSMLRKNFIKKMGYICNRK